MGRGVKIPWVWGSIYTMGRGHKISKFKKNLNFQNTFVVQNVKIFIK